MIRVEEVLLSEDRRKLLSVFMSCTEYGPSDILAYSSITKLFLTRNGGKYQLDGDKVIRLAGPSADPTERL